MQIKSEKLLFSVQREKEVKQEESSNAFIKAAQIKTTHSGNGALKYASSGNTFVDQMTGASRWKAPREYEAIQADCEVLWRIDPLKSIRFGEYLRGITRTPQGQDQVFRGQGLISEGNMRRYWLAVNHPADFYCNLDVMVKVGSWKDVFDLMRLDLAINGKALKLNWDNFCLFIVAGLSNPDTTNLVRKYLPTIKCIKKCDTFQKQANHMIGIALCKAMYNGYGMSDQAKYRRLKAQGNAHQWQQKISQRLYKEINFNTIAGRALAKIVGSKFLKNHNLETAYLEWIQSKPVAKYTGFVGELFEGLTSKSPLTQMYTINAQFKQLVQAGGPMADCQLLVCRDISGSMGAQAIGMKSSAYDVAKAMALYFSEFLQGPFANHYLTFAKDVEFCEWTGDTIIEKWFSDTSHFVGNTDFVQVESFLARMLKNGVPESEFPKGILCISDGEFDTANRWYDGPDNETNFQRFRELMLADGFSKEFVDNFKLILWDIPNSYYGESTPKFETFASCPNSFYMSGYDPSSIALLFGVDVHEDQKVEPKTSEELLEVALSQPLLQELVLS